MAPRPPGTAESRAFSPGEDVRGWHERRVAEGQVPEKIAKIAGWKRAIKDYMTQDPKLNDLVSLYATKFIQLGQTRNFTLSTLMDMAWAILVVTWEAILDDKLPLIDPVERGFKEKYEEMKDQLFELRRAWLAEITELRDQRRLNLPAAMQAALNSVNDMEDHDIYRFMPENALDEKTYAYFKAAMLENMKVAITRGAAAAGEQMQLLMKQLKELEEELEAMKEKLDASEQQRDLLEIRLQEALRGQQHRPPPPQKREAPPPSNDDELLKLRRELNAANMDRDAWMQKFNDIKELLQRLGIDIDNLDENSFRKKEPPPPPPPVVTGNNKELLAQITELKQTAAKLEWENKDLKSKLANLAQQLEQSQSQLAANKAEHEAKLQSMARELDAIKAAAKEKNPADAVLTAECAELKLKISELEKKIASLNQQLGQKAPPVTVAAGSQRTEDLESQVAKLNEMLKRLQDALAQSKKDAEAANQRLLEERAKAATDLAAARSVVTTKDVIVVESKFIEAPPNPGNGVATEDASQLREALAAMKLRVEQLEQQLKASKEANQKLQGSNATLREKLEEAMLMKQALNDALEELKRKFLELKAMLQERGIDTKIFDEVLAATGMNVILNPVRVFERLYNDAVRRRKTDKERRDLWEDQTNGMGSTSRFQHAAKKMMMTRRLVSRSPALADGEVRQVSIDDAADSGEGESDEEYAFLGSGACPYCGRRGSVALPRMSTRMSTVPMMVPRTTDPPTGLAGVGYGMPAIPAITQDLGVASRPLSRQRKMSTLAPHFKLVEDEPTRSGFRLGIIAHNPNQKSIAIVDIRADSADSLDNLTRPPNQSGRKRRASSPRMSSLERGSIVNQMFTPSHRGTVSAEPAGRHEHRQTVSMVMPLMPSDRRGSTMPGENVFRFLLPPDSHPDPAHGVFDGNPLSATAARRGRESLAAPSRPAGIDAASIEAAAAHGFPSMRLRTASGGGENWNVPATSKIAQDEVQRSELRSDLRPASQQLAAATVDLGTFPLTFGGSSASPMSASSKGKYLPQLLAMQTPKGARPVLPQTPPPALSGSSMMRSSTMPLLSPKLKANKMPRVYRVDPPSTPMEIRVTGTGQSKMNATA